MVTTADIHVITMDFATRLTAAHKQRGFKLAFEATARLDPAEQAMVKQLIEAILLRHEAGRWAS